MHEQKRRLIRRFIKLVDVIEFKLERSGLLLERKRLRTKGKQQRLRSEVSNKHFSSLIRTTNTRH